MDNTPQVNMTIDAKLDDIRVRHLNAMREEVREAETQYYREKFPELDIHSVRRTTKEGTFVNEVGLKHGFDQYLNGHFKWTVDVPPIELLPVFADLILRQEERSHPKHSYKYRVTQGMLISLAQKYHQEYNADQMMQILLLGDSLPVEGDRRHRQGFRAWLLTSSYTCDEEGALGSILRNWSHKTEFKKLLQGLTPPC